MILGRVLALAFLAAGVLAGCGRLPRVIVLSDPLSAREHLELGVAYERKGESDLAVREYERALRKDKTLVQARINLGNVHVEKREYPEAMEEYRKALTLQPGHPEATNNLAWAAIQSGTELEEATARLEAILVQEEHRTPALLDTLGVLRMRLHRPGAGDAFAEAERRCLAIRIEAGSGGETSAAGRPECPDAQLREIREHRADLAERTRAPTPPALVQ
jgi:tetratricopeptide (TPR) repeat protein